MGDTFEEVKPLHMGLDHDLRNVESDAFICGKISRRERGDKCLHALLTEPLLLLYLLRP